MSLLPTSGCWDDLRIPRRLTYAHYLTQQTQNQLTAHRAKALVLTCMDFRLIDDAVAYLNSQGYNNNYDQFILAGASLGYNQTTYDTWTEAFENHIDLAEQLHDIEEIIVIDHMKCGAYKLLYNNNNFSDDEERQLHYTNLHTFKETINLKYPHLKVTTLFMYLNGSVEVVA